MEEGSPTTGWAVKGGIEVYRGKLVVESRTYRRTAIVRCRITLPYSPSSNL